MNIEAIYHRPKLNWAYAYDDRTLHLRVRTKRNDVMIVELLAGDKYIWEQSKNIFSMHKFAADSLFDYWEIAVQPSYKRLTYAFHFISVDDQIWLTDHGFIKSIDETQCQRFFEFPYIHANEVFTPPSWVKDAVFYQIFPERFANGDPSISPAAAEPWGSKPLPGNFMGGDLQGIMDHLDYLRNLGINAIYLTPIFTSNSNHKYNTTDYFEIDPAFGTKETFKKLVGECHERGMRVMLDAVFNHSGKTFAPFMDVLEHGEQSRYANWFHIRRWPLQIIDGVPTYDTFSFSDRMPKLNTENPEVQDYLLQVAKYWIEEFKIDGWRLDVANEVDHAFWRRFRQIVKGMNPDVYILGEIWHDSLLWLQGDQFDAIMNYPLTNAVLDFFAYQTTDGIEFSNAIHQLLGNYQQQVHEVSFNLLGSHDTPRLLTLCNDNKHVMKLAVLFLLTYSGVPCIYYGDEIGLNGEGDPDCRKCMVWDEDLQDKDMFSFYRQLIHLRHEYSALRTGRFKFIYTDQGRIAYERTDGNHRLLILINRHSSSQTFSIEHENGSYLDLIHNKTILIHQNTLELELHAYSFSILKLK